MSASNPSAEPSEPAYLALVRSGELARRVPLALAGLACCAGCPRGCRVDRLHGSRLGLCRTGRLAQLAGAWPAAPEAEGCLNAVGQLAFAGGGLRSAFGGPPPRGDETEPERLADWMLALQAAGCRYLTLVNAGHVVPQVLEALLLAVRRGLRLPLVYATSAYDGLLSLRWLEGVVDVFCPVFILWDPVLALRYVRARNYPLAARRAIRAMHQQVGDLALDARGQARRGLLLRHAVLPGGAAGTRAVVRWLARHVSPRTAIHLSAQLLPPAACRERFPELSRPASPDEVAQALGLAQAAGLRLLA